MSALDELNRLILNSKNISEKDKADYRKKIDQAELEFIKDLFRGKKNENNDVYKK